MVIGTVMKLAAASESRARTVLDLPILQAVASSRLLALTARPVRSWRRVSSRSTLSLAPVSVGATSARASIAGFSTSDNGYYVN